MSEPKSRLGKSVASKGKNVMDKLDAPTIPWKGPEAPGPQGGITQGLLGKFILCRKRFYVRVYEGLTARDTFQSAIEYGNFWHAAEEAYKMNTNRRNSWLEAILKYSDELCAKYPMDREAVMHWYSLCREQFPIYIEFWHDQQQEMSRSRLLSEQTFDVFYKLPYSGRTVRLRGKWDGVSYLTEDKLDGVWLDENKTKSGIDHVQITRQLKFDLQTMLYIIALRERPSCDLHREGYYRHGGGETIKGVMYSGGVQAGEYLIRGVRYNVVRRSAHKSPESMVKKLQEDIDSGRGAEWFARWYTEITDADIVAFKRDCLDPALEQLCIWWDEVSAQATCTDGRILSQIATVRLPYGIYNPLDRGGEDAVDDYLNSGSRVGLQRVTNLFPELG